LAKPQRNKKPEPPAPASASISEPEAPAPSLPAARHVQPVGPRVLVRIIKSPDRLDSGLFLPQGVKDSGAAALLGEVVEVARTMPKAESEPTHRRSNRDDDDDDPDIDFGQNVSGIPLGSNVLFERDRGVAVPWDETLRLLDVRHVLAIVDIISQDDIQ
jgi:co-chaperonin GroES (HSP10)